MMRYVFIIEDRVHKKNLRYQYSDSKVVILFKYYLKKEGYVKFKLSLSYIPFSKSN